MDKKEFPYITQELIDCLKYYFRPITNTLDKDLRKLDYISGQLSVIEFLESIKAKQKGQ